MYFSVTMDKANIVRNTRLLRRLPTGFTMTATVQVAGRGRGSNVWVSPAGALMFSTVIRHPMEKMQLAPIVFVQYLAAMAVVKGIKTYDKGYEQLPIKMKWPNDVCKFPSPVFERYTDTRRCTGPRGTRQTKIYQNLRHPRQLPLLLRRIRRRRGHRHKRHKRITNNIPECHRRKIRIPRNHQIKSHHS